ncbi:MAG: hypothetical protein LBU07_05295 [Coriobacteriales bacterium]|nr:hypothetical protein [Coriobacteriales bacterium]
MNRQCENQLSNAEPSAIPLCLGADEKVSRDGSGASLLSQESRAMQVGGWF